MSPPVPLCDICGQINTHARDCGDSPTRLPELRCSELPRLWECPASGRSDGSPRLDTHGPAASLGRAVHECLANHVEGRPATYSLESYPDLDPEVVHPLARVGCRIWDALGYTPADSRAEVLLSCRLLGGTLLSGHLDAMVQVQHGQAIELLDWKTGRHDTNYRRQMEGYMWLALSARPLVKIARARIVWLRDEEISSYTMSRDGMDAWAAELVARVQCWDGITYSPGEVCTFCPRRDSCGALLASQRRDVAVFSRDLPGELAPADTLDLYEAAGRVERLARRFKSRLRDHIRDHGPLTDGSRTLSLADVPHRIVEPLAAWPVLCARLSAEQLADVVKISLPDTEDAICESLQRGEKGKAKAALTQELIAAGALTTRAVPTLTMKSAKKETT